MAGIEFGKFTSEPLSERSDEWGKEVQRQLERLENVLSLPVFPMVLLEELQAAPGKLFDGMVCRADGTNWDPGCGEGLYWYDGGIAEWRFIRTKLAPIIADSITLNNGTSAETVTDLQVMNDGNVYNLSEAATTPGMDLEIDFTDVLDFNGLAAKLYYNGSTSHWVEVQMYNYVSTAFDTFFTFSSGNGMNYRYIEIPDTSPYISSGAAQMRIYHSSAGTPTHDVYIDYVALI